MFTVTCNTAEEFRQQLVQHLELCLAQRQAEQLRVTTVRDGRYAAAQAKELSNLIQFYTDLRILPKEETLYQCL